MFRWIEREQKNGEGEKESFCGAPSCLSPLPSPGLTVTQPSVVISAPTEHLAGLSDGKAMHLSASNHCNDLVGYRPEADLCRVGCVVFCSESQPSIVA